MIRVDEASAVVPAPPDAVWQALTDPAALERWLPPGGATAKIEGHDLRPGGGYDMVLRFAPGTAGKSAPAEDRVSVRYTTVAPPMVLEQAVRFASANPAFAGTMRMRWSVEPDPGGSVVTVTCRDVPEGITAEDHAAGLNASLAQLGQYLERLAEGVAPPA